VVQQTRLPRCLHIELVIADNPAGETKEQAEKRLGGIAVLTGSFHHPRSMAIADFLQNRGEVIQEPTTSRWFLAVTKDGDVDISHNYALFKGRSGVSALALGQRLVPFHEDGFSRAFMGQITERMAIGLNKDSIFIVQGKSDIRRLAEFVERKLQCHTAINSDGGHVVRGKAPVHIVFRWRDLSPQPSVTAKAAPTTAAKQGSS
jgi:hypothetical protein